MIIKDSHLIVATNNLNKIYEIKAATSSIFSNVISLKDLNISIDIEENGETFFDNALIKAKTISNLINQPVLADDSGLSVDALNGAPGVKSARFSGPSATDGDNLLKLISELKKLKTNCNPKRIKDYLFLSPAHYFCCMVYYYPNGDIIRADGKTDGYITSKQYGNAGFGYDPCFYSSELGMTFAESSLEEKNRVSHRIRALNHFIEQLKSFN